MENTLENQVRSALEQARQSWEESLRAKQLALERLRLVKEEYEAALTTAKSAENALKAIQEKSGGDQAAKTLQELESQVAHLTKEVRSSQNIALEPYIISHSSSLGTLSTCRACGKTKQECV